MAFPRRIGLVAGVAIVLSLFALAFRPTDARHTRAQEQWKAGYWVWAGDAPAAASFTPDVLYVETTGSRWPHDLPAAGAYLDVQRIEASISLTPSVATIVAARYKAMVADAGVGVPILGLQIDYDCPTNKLDSYARFLEQLHQAMPQGHLLSITALLDWFGPRTSVASALRQVDEFVPQFYDTAHERTSAGIAQRIDAIKWAPVFNAYRVPYRIGISSFGRVARRRPGAADHERVQFFRDASPMDFADRSEYVPTQETTDAGELVVRYAVGAPDIGKPELLPGDVVEMTFPTEASVRAASDSAKEFAGYCAGIVAFRWPGRSETTSMSPDAVHQIVTGGALPVDTALDVRSARCIERSCADLYLDVGQLDPKAHTVTIAADGSLDAFLGKGPLQSRLFRSRDIRVRVPPYAGVGTFYVGRVVSDAPIHFDLTTQ